MIYLITVFLIQTLLQQEGYHIDVANNGSDAAQLH